MGIGITDLDRSLAFYRKYTGFDTQFVKPHEHFSGLVDEISGSKQTKVRSCVLASGKGGGMVELFEVIEPRGRSIPSYTIWGDFGYLQTCMMCKNVPEITAYFEKEGLEFLLGLQHMPGAEISFTYVRDPDGIPLEYLSFGKPELYITLYGGYFAKASLILSQSNSVWQLGHESPDFTTE